MEGAEQKMAAMMAGAGGGAPQPNAGGVVKTRNLEGCIMLEKSSVLNATKGSDLSYILKDHMLKAEQAELMLMSEDDEQLLFFVFFRQLVNLKSIRIRAAAPPYGVESSAPKVVKLWKNSPNMDFDDALDAKPLREFELSASDLEGGVDLDVEYLKFKNVDNLTIFIENNQDDQDVTFVNKIKFYGDAIDDFNMNNLKKSG